MARQITTLIGIIALVFGILILIFPDVLRVLVAIALIVIGILSLVNPNRVEKKFRR